MMGELHELTGIQRLNDTTSLYKFVSPFFLQVVRALRGILEGVMVEMVFSEVSRVVEYMRCELIERGRSFPQSFDVVHLSNIP